MRDTGQEPPTVDSRTLTLANVARKTPYPYGSPRGQQGAKRLAKENGGRIDGDIGLRHGLSFCILYSALHILIRYPLAGDPSDATFTVLQ
jgi:hypothetical protein